MIHMTCLYYGYMGEKARVSLGESFVFDEICICSLVC